MKRTCWCFYESSSSSSTKPERDEKVKSLNVLTVHVIQRTTNLRKKLQKHQRFRIRKGEMYGMVARSHWYCKKMIQRHAPVWRFYWPIQVSRPWLPTVSRIFSGSMALNSWLVCTVSLALLDSDWDSSRCPDWLRCFYRPWFRSGDWRDGDCWKRRSSLSRSDSWWDW